MFFIEIELCESISKIEDTLKRLGIKHDNNVYQTCHLVRNDDKYHIIHFKEYFSLYSFINNGKVEKEKIRMNEDDVSRRNGILMYLYRCEYISLSNAVIEYLQSDYIDVEYIKDDLNFISKIRL
jgi:hypothetical protein